MDTPRDSPETLIDNIFANDDINNQQLKVFLKLISTRIYQPFDGNVNAEDAAHEEEDQACQDYQYEELFETDYLSKLITKCEERLAKLAETPKTKIVIRNEGKKLQSIIESVEALKCVNCQLQNQIDDLSIVQQKLKKVICNQNCKNLETFDQLRQNCMNADLRNLNTMYYGLQNQVDELTVKSHNMEQDILMMKEKLNIVDRTSALEEKVIMLLDWRASLQEEFNLLNERYEHIKTVKASKSELLDLLEKKVNYCFLSRYIRRETFDTAKQEFTGEFNELKTLFCELQLSFSAKLVALQKSVQTVISKINSKRRIEKPL